MNAIKALILLSVLFISSCDEKPEPPLKIVASSWIGYSPLFYAQESGWLTPLNITLTNVVSLGEALRIYESAGMDAIAGTQYEFNQVHAKDHSVMPVIMFDRSNGGDLIMSNQSIASLQKSDKTINVYLEMDSVNYFLFKSFIAANRLEGRKYNYINKDQLKISALRNTPTTGPTIIVTYVPYNAKLALQGFHVLASTRQGLDLLVVDGLYTSKATLIKHRAQFVALKSLVDKAIRELEVNPKGYYEKIKTYLENPSYDDFMASLGDIVWLNKPLPDELVKRLNATAYPVRDLIQ